MLLYNNKVCPSSLAITNGNLPMLWSEGREGLNWLIEMEKNDESDENDDFLLTLSKIN